MKKRISVLLAVGLLAGLLCGTAQAADSQSFDGGFYNIGTASGVTVTPLESGGSNADRTSANVDNVSGYETFYPGSVKLTVKLTPAYPGSEYVVLLVAGAALPTRESDIYYIDQITAGDTGSVSFNVYPMDITVTDLTLFITSDQESFTTRSVSLHYAPAGTYEVQPYTLGDVNQDQTIRVDDALLILNYLVGKADLQDTQILAADINKDEIVRVDDALAILNYLVGKTSTLG